MDTTSFNFFLNTSHSRSRTHPTGHQPSHAVPALPSTQLCSCLSHWSSSCAEAVGGRTQTPRPCPVQGSSQRVPPGTHRPWCPVPSFQRGLGDVLLRGEGWSRRELQTTEQARGNGDCKGSLSRIRGRPACHACNLLPSSACLLLLPSVFSSSFPFKPECGFPSCFAPAPSQHIPAPASAVLLSQSLALPSLPCSLLSPSPAQSLPAAGSFQA